MIVKSFKVYDCEKGFEKFFTFFMFFLIFYLKNFFVVLYLFSIFRKWNPNIIKM